MNLLETHAFVAVVRAGSFTAAGKRLGVPKSTLSKQVLRLEEALGARLLHRTTRRLSLTETGEAYYQRCLRAIEEIEDAERVVADVSGAPRGLLKVAAPFDLARDRLTKLLPAFRARYPEIDLQLFLSQERVDLVGRGFDVALRGGVLPDAGFVARRLFGSELGLYAAPRYLAARGTPVTVEELATHDVVAFGPAPPFPLEGPHGAAPLDLRPWLVVNEWGTAREALLDGLGLGLQPVPNGDADERAGLLVRLLPDHAVRGGGLFAVYPSRHHLTPKVRVFVDFLVEFLPPAIEAGLRQPLPPDKTRSRTLQRSPKRRTR